MKSACSDANFITASNFLSGTGGTPRRPLGWRGVVFFLPKFGHKCLARLESIDLIEPIIQKLRRDLREQPWLSEWRVHRGQSEARSRTLPFEASSPAQPV